MTLQTNLRTLSQPVLFVSYAYPPASGGSTVIMRNLMEAFHPSGFHLATRRTWGGGPTPAEPFQVHKIMHTLQASKKLSLKLQHMQIPRVTHALCRLVRRHGFKAIVGTYPEIFLLRAALDAALAMEIPFVAYLHDTIAEAMANKADSAFSERLQADLFHHAAKIFVMSQGMADLYRKKYDIEAEPLLHPYPEPIPRDLEETELDANAFWSGNAYEINQAALLRVYDALIQDGRFTLKMATAQKRENLESKGFNRGLFEVAFIGKRKDLLDTLRRQQMHLLALSWPDESSVHEDELGTIFPTKTIEYLASGRPILLHCPEHYFLARFCCQHQCALVVSERDPKALNAAITRMVSDKEFTDNLCRNGLKAAASFSVDAVTRTFQSGLDQVWAKQRSPAGTNLDNREPNT